ncbi:hypothetical protein SAMN06265374_3720 [Roseibium denhamense]|uniref:Uncharacterized protein n=1 Tax=Roseibium denhamense TaxID=76305 RepID=A0ABY1PGP1_9HYPH|nr:hypothetical protein SAMN06265374_3720 [Roseibium denhamense]
MKSKRSALTQSMIKTFCEKRLAPVFTPQDVEVLHRHLVDLLERNEYPAYRGSRLDVRALAERLGLDSRYLMIERSNLQPIFDAVTRSITETALRPEATRKNSHTELSGCQSPSRLRPCGRIDSGISFGIPDLISK